MGLDVLGNVQTIAVGGGAVSLQALSPGVSDVGNFHISGVGIVGSLVADTTVTIAVDTGLNRTAAGVLTVTNGAAGTGVLREGIGGSVSFGMVPVIANVNVTPVGTPADVAAHDLMTYSLPANALSANGRGVRIRAWGSTLVGANNQTIQLLFGASNLFGWGATPYGSTTWNFDAIVIRSGAGAQVTTNNFVIQGVGNGVVNSVAAEAEAGAIVIKVTGQNGAAVLNGVQQLGMVVEMLN